MEPIERNTVVKCNWEMDQRAHARVGRKEGVFFTADGEWRRNKFGINNRR